MLTYGSRYFRLHYRQVIEFVNHGDVDVNRAMFAVAAVGTLAHAYEYTCREDILLSLEYNDLSPRQVAALLKSPSPLADVFKKWEKQETNHMDDIWNTVTARANEVVRADFVAQRKDEAR